MAIAVVFAVATIEPEAGTGVGCLQLGLGLQRDGELDRSQILERERKRENWLVIISKDIRKIECFLPYSESLQLSTRGFAL